MARIAVGGFQHETNTFAPQRAAFDDFEKHDGWPGLVRGEALLPAVEGMNLPIAGFIAEARPHGHELVPLSWCSAEPSSYVTEDAFERITAMMCGDLAAHMASGGPFDAVYLDLHGAMVPEHHEDGEGEILARVRAVVGDQIPVVVSLDLHANVTEAMVARATALTIFRTYPHIDMAATGARAYGLLTAALSGQRLAKAFRKLPYLIPLTAQCTYFEPNRSLYAAAAETQALSGDIALGFPPADIGECGPSLVTYDPDPATAEAAANALLAAMMAAEPAFENPLMTPDDAITRAMANATGRPVVLADAQDNPGAGGSADTVGLLTALVNKGAKGAVMALLNDPEVNRQAQAAGVGGRFEAALGGKSGQPGHSPMPGTFHVEALGDGRFTGTGTMLQGARMELGPLALLRVADDSADVRVIVGSKRFQCLDRSIFLHLGVDPADQRIVAVKSTVHFRDDFDPIAAETLAVEAPGAHPCRLTAVPYRRLRSGVRLEPGGPVFTARAAE